ncbi:MAG: pyridoxamine 5'-phosphate oxidase family protein [Rhodospirillales bacterium]|nr:pyridoxamine 5'-phosphate oxidase family protein [Rhodospirillales bacterium]
MSVMEANCLEVWAETEFVAIVTQGEDGPHMVGNWGDYARKLGLRGDTVILPAGRYHQTEANLVKDNRVTLLIASKKVQGSRNPGQGYALKCTAKVVTEGALVVEVKEQFAWARGALVIEIKEAIPQL